MNLQIFIIEGSVYVNTLEDFFKKINIEGCDIAILNANYVADRKHAEFAARKAIKSWYMGKRVARTLPMEVLLYASATRQINKALEMGIREKQNNRVFAVIAGSKSCVEKFKSLTGFKEENVLEMTEEKIENLKRFFEIKDEEIEIVGKERIPEIIRERIVIFDIMK